MIDRPTCFCVASGRDTEVFGSSFCVTCYFPGIDPRRYEPAYPLISRERILDEGKVVAKTARLSVFIVRVAESTVRGRRFRVLTDGPHNLAAALRSRIAHRASRIAPLWRGPSTKWIRIQSTVPPKDFEPFLIENLTDADWYSVDSGGVVTELLAHTSR